MEKDNHIQPIAKDKGVPARTGLEEVSGKSVSQSLPRTRCGGQKCHIRPSFRVSQHKMTKPSLPGRSLGEGWWIRRQGRSNGISLEVRIKRLSIYIRGWMNYYGISQYYRPMSGIDCWLRRRIPHVCDKLWDEQPVVCKPRACQYQNHVVYITGLH